ncbi:MAG: nucleoside triphosphate pyrophosphohydrolase family protein [Nonlabens sp.]
MKKQIESVYKFHDTFKLGINTTPTAHITEQRIKLRHELMREENEEYLDAAMNNDLIEVADALGDMLYILCGTIIEHGMQEVIEDVFDEIQNSNMSKLDASGKPIYREDGKVLKSPQYFRPEFSKILSRYTS